MNKNGSASSGHLTTNLEKKPTFKYIGKSSPRIEGREKISGATRYVDDLDFGPNLM